MQTIIVSDIHDLADLCADFVKQGIGFKAEPISGGWQINFTGGF